MRCQQKILAAHILLIMMATKRWSRNLKRRGAFKFQWRSRLQRAGSRESKVQKWHNHLPWTDRHWSFFFPPYHSAKKPLQIWFQTTWPRMQEFSFLVMLDGFSNCAKTDGDWTIERFNSWTVEWNEWNKCNAWKVWTHNTKVEMKWNETKRNEATQNYMKQNEAKWNVWRINCKWMEKNKRNYCHE